MLLAVAGSALAEFTRCGTAEPNDTAKAAMNEAFFSADVARVVAQAVSVDTYVHIVTSQSKQGQFSEAMAREQVSSSRQANLDQ